MTQETASTIEARAHDEVVAVDRTPHVLVVDDNSDIVTVLCRILRGHGFRASTASDGVEGLQKARDEQPDVILLDWMMPGLDGLEVCRRLKADPATRTIMIILVTGRGSVAHRVEGLEAGADDFVPKPFHHPELLARIRSALRIKHLTDELALRNREVVKSQIELMRQEKMATIGLLASGLAHEFNNIMAGISGYAQLARSNPKFTDRLIEIALTQTERALELTRSLASYNSTQCTVAATDFRAIAESTLHLVRKKAEDQGLEIVVDVEPGLPKVRIKPGQLQEVLLNLLLNAIQATTQRGRVTIRARVAANHRVQFEVEDTGRGIPDANLHRIFDPFFTTKGALGGGSEGGTGLGLTVCYNILRARGGTIAVESQVGRGSRFTVELPATVDDDTAILDRSSAEKPETTATPEKRMRVLVVDDETHIRSMIAALLEDHDVTLAADGETAAREYELARFDWVVLDLCLQNSISGHATLERILRIDPEARVVVASGKLPEDIDPAILSRVHGHLLKPYKLEDLAEILGVGSRVT
jgi:two-component system NtrC family sensor kinase